MTDLPQHFRSRPGGLPAASDGPSAKCKADVCETSCMDKMCDAAQQANTRETISMDRTRDVAQTVQTWQAGHSS